MNFSRFQWFAALIFATQPVSCCLGQDIFRGTDSESVLRHTFSSSDEELLDAIQRGCFNYLWRETGVPGRLAKDRRTTLVASSASIGFQLSALPIGVERRWITREEAEQRALTVLRTIAEAPNNRHEGVYLHFVNADNGQVFPPYHNEASTVDQSLLLAGAMPAAVYFGGEAAKIVNRLAAETNWKAFQKKPDSFIGFGWNPADNVTMDGPGKYMDHEWHIASDEERLIYFIAVGSGDDEPGIDPKLYYKLQRTVKGHGDMPPYVVSWNGSLFTYFFAHLWIDYRGLGPDNPRDFGVEAPRVDWFENSRRAVLTHRQKCIEAAGRFATLGADRWGLAPCMAQVGERPNLNYIVPEVPPSLSNNEQWHDGTIAPYAAGSSIMFAPEEAMTALRAFRELKRRDGEPLVWRDPAEGAYGFADSFNLDQNVATDDNVGIDAGPMLLAIENARTGLIWRLFMEHEIAQQAVERLKLERIER